MQISPKRLGVMSDHNKSFHFLQYMNPQLVTAKTSEL